MRSPCSARGWRRSCSPAAASALVNPSILTPTGGAVLGVGARTFTFSMPGDDGTATGYTLLRAAPTRWSVRLDRARVCLRSDGCDGKRPGAARPGAARRQRRDRRRSVVLLGGVDRRPCNGRLVAGARSRYDTTRSDRHDHVQPVPDGLHAVDEREPRVHGERRHGRVRSGRRRIHVLLLAQGLLVARGELRTRSRCGRRTRPGTSEATPTRGRSTTRIRS